MSNSEDATSSGEDEWFWRVVYTAPKKSRNSVVSVQSPHRAAAKQKVADKYQKSVSFDRCYIPRPSWDCPICGVSEGMSEKPNMESPPSWECLHCGTLGWGEPMDWDYLSEPSTRHELMNGHKTPDGPRSEAPTGGGQHG